MATKRQKTKARKRRHPRDKPIAESKVRELKRLIQTCVDGVITASSPIEGTPLPGSPAAREQTQCNPKLGEDDHPRTAYLIAGLFNVASGNLLG